MKGNESRSRIFETDVRVTVNYENKKDLNDIRNVPFRTDNIRIKTRTSY